MPAILDLSHEISEGMTIFPGDPRPEVTAVEGVEPWHVSKFSMGTHCGTHIDAPYHMYSDGKKLDQYPIDRFIGSGIMVEYSGLEDDQPIPANKIREVRSLISVGGVVIFRTGWDKYWGTERYMRHPYLSPELVNELVERNVGLVGIDVLGPDSTVQETKHAHEAFFGKDILIVENLTRLDQLKERTVYQFSFFPLPIPGMDGAPIRAVAWEN